MSVFQSLKHRTTSCGVWWNIECFSLQPQCKLLCITYTCRGTTLLAMDLTSCFSIVRSLEAERWLNANDCVQVLELIQNAKLRKYHTKLKVRPSSGDFEPNVDKIARRSNCCWLELPAATTCDVEDESCTVSRYSEGEDVNSNTHQ